MCSYLSKPVVTDQIDDAISIISVITHPNDKAGYQQITDLDDSQDKQEIQKYSLNRSKFKVDEFSPNLAA